MASTFPANPMAIELNYGYRQQWWQPERGTPPKHIDISADAWRLAECEPQHRHVGDISLVVADVEDGVNLLDMFTVGESTTRFLMETAVGPDGGLNPALEQQVGPAPERAAIIRHVEIRPAWREKGVATALLSGVLCMLRPVARFALCSINDNTRHSDDTDTNSTGRRQRLRSSLLKFGFVEWNDVYVVDLGHQAIDDARKASIEHFSAYAKEFG